MRKLVLLGNIDVNCYFIERNNKCYIVDPGQEKQKIIKYVNEQKLDVLGILLTHAHIDHAGAIDCFPVPIYLHKDEYEVLIDNQKNGAGKEKVSYDLNDLNIVTIDETASFRLDDQVIKVIHTPGHTIGSVCYSVGQDLYTGDTLFKGTVGRVDLPTGDLEAMKRSIVNLIDEQDGKARIYPGHGESSTIEDEKENNLYYIEWKG